MGPLIESDHIEKVTRYNELARREGVDVLVDRTDRSESEIPEGHEDGHWIGPFVYEDLRCTHEEVFGPHVASLQYDGDIEAAVGIHNDTDYGLAGAVIFEDYRELNYSREYAEIGLAYTNLSLYRGGSATAVRWRKEIG